MHTLGVDWGGSNRRAYLLDGDGALLAQRQDGTGALALTGQDFQASLYAWLGDWLGEYQPRVWLSGMVGSRGGWREAPYLAAPVSLLSLASAALPLDSPGHWRIVPGVSQRGDAGANVMRGEETQLLGAWRHTGADGWYVLPGTHSKWVRLEGGRVRRFHTFMTGELFAQLRASGSLAPLTQGPADHLEAFDQGLRQGLNGALLADLFSIRAGSLLGAWPAGEAAARLSGLLIGSEWAAAQRIVGPPGADRKVDYPHPGHTRVDELYLSDPLAASPHAGEPHAAASSGDIARAPIFLIGASLLSERYSRAAAAVGLSTITLPSDECYRLALQELSRTC